MKLLKYKNRPKCQVKDEDVNLLVGHLARIGGKTTVKHIKSALQVLAWNPCNVTNPPNIDWGEVINVAVEKGVVKRGLIKYGYQNRTMVWLPHVDPSPQKMVRKTLVGFLVSVLSMALLATPSVVNVTAQQRYPWNELVDIAVAIQGSADDMAETVCSFAATNSATKAEILVAHVTRNGDDTGSGTVWTRKFIWNAKADVGAVKIDDVALTVDLKPLGGVQLWENGPYWAECNVGAKKPEECGYYFWWGDTVGYKRNANNDGWISVKDSTSYSFNGCPTHGKYNSQLKSAGYIDATGNLVAKYDAATAHLGAPWRMPTDAEFSALVNNCTTTWTTRNGVSGRLVTGKGAYSSKSIFLPAAGYGDDSYLYRLGSNGHYWSSTPSSDYSDTAWYLGFGSGYFDGNYYSGRGHGQSVRPVRGFAK